tara:strand:- start:507 stop:731 length:225 start_codon:yes stop_codon:yes gene_type:complete
MLLDGNGQSVAGPTRPRIFGSYNPVRQGEMFESHGQYMRQLVPILVHLPYRFVYEPWAAPRDVLRDAHVKLEQN